MRRPLAPLLLLPALAACSEREIDAFFDGVAALMIAGMVIAAALAVFGLLLSIVELTVLFLNLIRPRWVSVAVGAAIGVLHALTTVGAAGVWFVMQPPPIVEPQPPPVPAPTEDLTLLVFGALTNLTFSAGQLGAAWYGWRRLSRRPEDAEAG
ncbi:MAG TPA: hypothetical protein PKA64_24765 [Myxococcota bacterium]|nr:hypothetical protein [Myxococcota bacterium]